MTHVRTVDDVPSYVSIQIHIKKSSYRKGWSLSRTLMSLQNAENIGSICFSYLRDLQKQASNWQRVSGIKRPRVGSLRLDEEENLGRSSTAVEVLATEPADSPASNESDPTLNIWTSPFTSPSTIFKEAFKEQRKWSTSNQSSQFLVIASPPLTDIY